LKAQFYSIAVFLVLPIMHSISHTERDGAKHGHARDILLLDMSSLDLFPSTLVVLARSMSGLFFIFFCYSRRTHYASYSETRYAPPENIK